MIAEHWYDYSLVSQAAPAAPGEYIVLYLVGMGAVDRTVASGAAAPLNPLARVTSQPTVKLNGVSVPVLYAGLAPGWVGLYQINIQLPSSFAADGNMTLTVTQNGVVSNTTLIPVRK